MKVKLLKDVMLPANGTKDKPNVGEPVVAEVNDVVEMPDTMAKDWIKRGLCEKAEDSTPVTIEKKPDGEGGEQHVLTTRTVKPGADRSKKIQVGATETK